MEISVQWKIALAASLFIQMAILSFLVHGETQKSGERRIQFSHVSHSWVHKTLNVPSG